MEFACVSCQKKLRVADAHAGKNIRCPSCQAVVRVPELSKPTTQRPQVVAKAISKAAPTPNHLPISDTLPPPPSNFDFPMPPSSVWSPPRRIKPKRSGVPAHWWVAGVVGSLAGLGLLLVGFFALSSLFSSGSSSPGNAASGNSIVDNTVLGSTARASATVPSAASGSSSKSKVLPTFPELGTPQALGDTDVYFVDLGRSNAAGLPGFTTKMRVYLPRSATASHSIPLMLVAPAGTPLFHGNDVDAGDYHDESRPYAEAGMAVIMYSLDGSMVDPESVSEIEYVNGLTKAYQTFGAAKGGVTNAQMALEFALAKLPQVDPNRIYCAGHSSAGTISLLLATKDDRIAAGIAYAPATDLTIRFHEMLQAPEFHQILPGIREFARENSPSACSEKVRCPLFIFHSQDDSNEPFRNTQKYVESLKQSGKDITFSTVARGDHYQPMIDTGIPRAIEWLKSR